MLTCWRADMLTCSHVEVPDLLKCWHIEIVTCWHADMLSSWPDGADTLKCLNADMLRWWHADNLTCWHAKMLTYWKGDMLKSVNADMVKCWYDHMQTAVTLTQWHAFHNTNRWMHVFQNIIVHFVCAGQSQVQRKHTYKIHPRLIPCIWACVAEALVMLYCFLM